VRREGEGIDAKGGGGLLLRPTKTDNQSISLVRIWAAAKISTIDGTRDGGDEN
jgi:hypothetical protein